jgi:hypothetical protein
MRIEKLLSMVCIFAGCRSGNVYIGNRAPIPCIEDDECLAVDTEDVCRGTGGCPEAAIHRDELETYELFLQAEYDDIGCGVDVGDPPHDGYAPDCVAKAECLEGFCALTFDR